MSDASNGFSFEMNASLPASNKFALSEVGIDFREDLSFEEWSDLGQRIACAGRSLGFLIGDWVNYGESRKDYGKKYSEALQATGFDYSTLKLYSRVARHIDRVTRVTQLSFEHHRKVAMLEPEEQKRWLGAASKAKEKGEPLSTRRLAKSILLKRLASDEDMETPSNDRGQDNVHPHVNRIIAFWNRMRDEAWLETAEPDRIAAMLEDLAPVLKMADELREALAAYEANAR